MSWLCVGCVDRVSSIALSYDNVNIDGEILMSTVTVSPKYQIVIPKEIRTSSGIVSGQKIQMIGYGDRIQLIPIVPITSLRGTLEGIDTSVERDADRP